HCNARDAIEWLPPVSGQGEEVRRKGLPVLPRQPRRRRALQPARPMAAERKGAPARRVGRSGLAGTVPEVEEEVIVTRKRWLCSCGYHGLRFEIWNLVESFRSSRLGRFQCGQARPDRAAVSPKSSLRLCRPWQLRIVTLVDKLK